MTKKIWPFFLLFWFFSAHVNAEDTSTNKNINLIAYQSDLSFDAVSNLNELNSLMQQNYNGFIQSLSQHIYPIIVVTPFTLGTSSGTGSQFILYLPHGASESFIPFPLAFYELKAVAHIPVGIFSLVAPYFNSPNDTQWIDPLMKYRLAILKALGSIDHTTLSAETKSKTKKAIQLSIDFIDQSIRAKRMSADDFKQFGAQFTPYAYYSLYEAMAAYELAIVEGLTRWKKKLGPEWHNVYAVVMALEITLKNNPNALALESLMDPDQVKSHIFVTAQAKTINEALLLLTRELAAPIMGSLIFDPSNKENRELLKTLSPSARTAFVGEAAKQGLAKIMRGGLSHTGHESTK